MQSETTSPAAIASGRRIPTLSQAPVLQMLEAILRPIAYYRRCLRGTLGRLGLVPVPGDACRRIR